MCEQAGALPTWPVMVQRLWVSRLLRHRKAQLLLVNLLTFGLEVCLAAGITYVPPLLLEVGVEEKFMTMVLGESPHPPSLLLQICVPWGSRATGPLPKELLGGRGGCLLSLSLVGQHGWGGGDPGLRGSERKKRIQERSLVTSVSLVPTPGLAHRRHWRNCPL